MRSEGPHVLEATAAALAKQVGALPNLVLFLDLADRRSLLPRMMVGALDVRGDALGRLEGGGALGAAARGVATGLGPDIQIV